MSFVEILTVTAAVGVFTIVALVFGKRFRAVVSETLKHPLKRTEIKVDEKGKVLEIKVSDNLGNTDSASVERHSPERY